MSTKSDLSLIKQIPIIEVAKRLGIQVLRMKAMCFMGHDKATPSLSFHKKTNSWKCFGACDKGGDGIALVMEKGGLEFKSALTWFANNFHVDVVAHHQGKRQKSRVFKPKQIAIVSKTRVQDEKEFAADPELYAWFIGKCSGASSPTSIKYLDDHSISQESARHFNVRELHNPEYAFRKLIEKWGEHRVYKSGIALDVGGRPERLVWGSNALLFPFYEQEKVFYIQARMLEGKPKFLNPRDLTKPLFNTDRLSDLPAGHRVHLCEGVPDAIALESHGLAAVGVLGSTSFRAEWVDRFLKFKVVLLGDGDAAGAKFVETISKVFIARGKPVQFLPLRKGMDVSDVLAQAARIK